MESQEWGVLTAIDLHGCDLAIISDADALKEFIKQLVDLIDMVPYGDCQVIGPFGEGNKEGYSLMQMIMTSNICGHFSNEDKAAYIDIFSCKSYDSKVAANFCKDYFKAEKCKYQAITRGLDDEV